MLEYSSENAKQCVSYGIYFLKAMFDSHYNDASWKAQQDIAYRPRICSTHPTEGVFV